MAMYEKFAKTGWTTELARQTNRQLMPLIIRAVVLGWLSAVWLAEEQRALSLSLGIWRTIRPGAADSTTHPLGERVRSAMFNSLGETVRIARVLVLPALARLAWRRSVMI